MPNAIADAVIQTLDGDTLTTQADKCESADGSTTGVISDKILTSINVNNDQTALSITKKANVKSAEIGGFC